MTFLARATALLLLAASGTAAAQQLDVRFACSAARSEDGENVTYADHGEFRIDGTRIDAFRWESALYRSTHGFDCSIDEGDGVQAEVRPEASSTMWRVMLKDAQDARSRRGFTFSRGMNCSFRLQRSGDTLAVTPSCPALCGSRANFSALSVDLKTGACRYEKQ